MSLSEIKPCPFCGGHASLVEDSDHHGDFYSLGCDDKMCYGHWAEYTTSEDEVPKAKAIEKWNTRAQP